MKKTITIIGTAHQSITPGKRSPDGAFREYLYSRQIARQLYTELIKEGIMSFIDFTEDQFAPTSKEELIKRTLQVNSIVRAHPDANCLYVSIHNNAAGDGSSWCNARGWSVYTTKGQTKADPLATCLWNRAKELLPHDHINYVRSDFADGDPDYESNFYVLAHTSCPAVLTENLFQDNKQDVKFLLSDEGRNIITEIHKLGILDYISKL